MIFFIKYGYLQNMCYNSSSKFTKSNVPLFVFVIEQGAVMKLSNYILICLICALTVVAYGCSKLNNPVVNTKSGIVIHSEDFTKSGDTNIDNQNVIRLGDGYEKIELDLNKDKDNTIKL